MKFPAPFILLVAASTALAGEPGQLSGIYPHLAFYNDEGECGTGAVVPWAGSLWAITYAPHMPAGSSDKLYQITPDLTLTVRPESIGGTPANRMIHTESDQLFIGPYAIDGNGTVRAIPYARMFGRHTGTARHLDDPAGKVVYATMEEGIYEVDVKSLGVKELWGDEAAKDSPRKADLPGYHGKGFYSGQGVYVYANNGDHSREALVDPESPSGVLAEWDGKAAKWTVVRRNQFTEITGPGGITGNPNPATDPIWAVGWDAKSLLLGTRMPERGWTFQRLPKASHSYDGAHGWNTEWPRIRDVGEKDFLMTMHGTFWRFPKSFAPGHSAGIAPRSNYLKVIGDFCRWNDKIVFGCDDTAKSEFLNKRKAKGNVAAPQSQSNLWFLDPAAIDKLGPAIGRGAVWMHENVAAGTPSDAFLFSGYDRMAVQLAHTPTGGTDPVITIEVDKHGDGTWSKLREIKLASAWQCVDLTGEQGAWVRVTSNVALEKASAWFQFANVDKRDHTNGAIFAGLATAGSPTSIAGVMRARDTNKRTLALAATGPDGQPTGAYELTADLQLVPATDPGLLAHTLKAAAIPKDILKVDAASVLYVDDNGKRWRLPMGDAALTMADVHGDCRVDREVATERDLFHAHGTFYELPAGNAGGFAKVRPVATHNLRIHDYCSYRGLFVLTGIDPAAGKYNPHVIRSADGKASVWAGAIDDVWQMGKPRGHGGPWSDTRVRAGQTSDPYLMTGYDKKSLELASSVPVTITAEIDMSGAGEWVTYEAFRINGKSTHVFPPAFQAYWIRFTSDKDTTATARLTYE